jgi:ATP-binding cassette subfamily B protein
MKQRMVNWYMNKLKDFRKVFDNNIFILKYAFKISPLYVFMSVGIGVVQQVFVFFEHVYSIKFILDCIQYKKPFVYIVIYLTAIMIFSIMYLFWNKYYYASLNRKLQEKLFKSIRADIYKKASTIDLINYDNPNYYNDYVWAMSESTNRTDQVLSSMGNFLTSLTMFLLNGFFVLSMDMFGIVFVIVSFLGTFLITNVINKINFKFSKDIMPNNRIKNYIARVFYLKDYASELRLNNISPMLFSKYSDNKDEIINKNKKIFKYLPFLNIINNYGFNTLLFNTIYIIYLAFRAIVQKTISFGSVIMIVRSANWLTGTIRSLTYNLPDFKNHSLYIEKIRAFLDNESKINDGENHLNKIDSIQLKDLSFSYDENTHVLKNINLKINKNEKIAIVGLNGAGKSTLVNVLLRLYEADSGEVLINGKNIKSFNISELHNRIGTVFQDHQLFAMSIAENISMNSENIDQKRVYSSLELSGFSGKLSQMKNDINTELTKEFSDEGAELSGGEVQKIAIARAIYKDIDLLIMDEPSAALDPLSEFHLNNSISEMSENKIVVFISHRLSTTRLADRIYYIENGEIVESGSHIELMKQNGKYAYMFNVQAEKYNDESL